MLIGISSAWCSRRFAAGAQLLDALLELGCDGLELEYRVTQEQLRGMGPRLGREVPVFSVHAFFPNPGVPGGEVRGANAFPLSSTDRERREEAVRRGIETLEAAARIRARAVVFHLGKVPVGDEALGPYRKLVVQDDPPIAALREAAGPVCAARERLAAPCLEAALRSLERLNREAGRLGLLIGVENRYNPHEIPSLEETAVILGEFRGGAVRAWHDVGHALYQESLGLVPRGAWLEAFAPHLAGAHLHDIRGARDHLAPGTGEADFAAILARLPPDAVRIMEIRPSVPREELLAGLALLRRLGC